MDFAGACISDREETDRPERSFTRAGCGRSNIHGFQWESAAIVARVLRKLSNIYRAPNSEQELSSCRDGRPFGHNWHGPKRWLWSAPILYNGLPLSLKLPLHMGDLDPHLIHGSLVPTEYSTQTASRSVQPLLYDSLVWQTDRQTDIPRYSVGNNIVRI